MPNYLILAGEPSGDLLGAEFISAMAKLDRDLVPLAVGGNAMREQAGFVFEDVRNLSLMGFSAILSRAAFIREYAARVLAIVDRYNPKFVVLIDYPGLHVYLAEQIKLRQIPVIQMVAPQLWAWHASRVHRWKKAIDLLLVILPFEVEFFANYGLCSRYIGTPQVDRALKSRLPKQSFGFSSKRATVGLFPGSRLSELQRMLPIFLETRDWMIKQGFKGEFAVSLAETLEIDNVKEVLQQSGYPHLTNFEQLERTPCDTYRLDDRTLLVHGASLKLMAAVDAAAVTSGTATLECALNLTPMCVAYRTSSFNYWLAKRLITVKDIGLVNLIAGKRIVEEFIQDFDAKTLGSELSRLVNDQSYREDILQKLSQINSLLTGNTGANAAKIVYDHLNLK